MKILISPYSQKPPSGNPNAKNYPFWKDLIPMIKHHDIVQIGVDGEEKICDDFRIGPSMADILKLLRESDLFISVDNFLPHMAHYYGKRGIVIFAQSDPSIFGYSENINLLKDMKYLRTNQFDSWNECPYRFDAFVLPDEVVKAISIFETEK